MSYRCCVFSSTHVVLLIVSGPYSFEVVDTSTNNKTDTNSYCVGCNGAYQEATDATQLIQEELETGNQSEIKLRHQANRLHTMAKKVNGMAWHGIF